MRDRVYKYMVDGDETARCPCVGAQPLFYVY